MRAYLFLLGSSCGACFAVAAACSSFGGETASIPAVDAGADAPAVVAPPSCPDGPRLVDDIGVEPDAHCGPNGAVVDLSDHEHCGACGHACGTGTCASRMCTPEYFLGGESLLAAQVVDGRVYYVNTAHQIGSGAMGAALGKLFTYNLLPAGQVSRVQVHPPWLYVSAAGGLVRLALDDSGSEPVPPGPKLVGGIIAPEPNGYFYATTTGVERYGKFGSLSANSPGTTNVVADGDRAYWATSSDAGAALHGPFPTIDPLSTAAASVAAMAVDATHIYFADPRALQIRRIARSGGSLQSVTGETGTSIGDLALDGDYVYWTADRGSVDGWVVMRVAKCGGVPLMLAKGLQAMTHLSFDRTSVYAIEASARGELLGIAK